MNELDVWNLFKKTGKLEYYLDYKRMLEKKVDILGYNGSKGDSN